MTHTKSLHLELARKRVEQYLAMLGCCSEASHAVIQELNGTLADDATEAQILDAAFAKLNERLVGHRELNPAAIIHAWFTRDGAVDDLELADFQNRAWGYPPINRTLMAPPRRREQAGQRPVSTIESI
ncbi:MAG: hypothetical protein ACFCUG_01115 [Thiotrichales bacterium]